MAIDREMGMIGLNAESSEDDCGDRVAIGSSHVYILLFQVAKPIDQLPCEK